nr:MAG TPA: toxin [Bacteriophage sp.]
MNLLLYYYLWGGLVSMGIVLLCAFLAKSPALEGIKVALIAGLIWPIAWPLCVYMIIKGRNKK